MFVKYTVFTDPSGGCNHHTKAHRSPQRMARWIKNTNSFIIVAFITLIAA